MIRLFIMIDWITCLLLYILYAIPRWQTSKYTLFVKSCWYWYLCFVAYFTIMPILLPLPMINLSLSHINGNLVPFLDVMMQHGGAYQEILLNVLMMIPMGILLPFIYHTDFKRTMLLVVLSSVFIEFYQLTSVRGVSRCDITDLLTNTFGGFLGYLSYRGLHKPSEYFLQKVFPEKPFAQPIWQTPEKVRKFICAILVFFLLFRSIFFHLL